MSDEFEVHGPHDHALEHAAEHGRGDSFASRVAVMAAVLATVGAIFSYQSGNTENQALIYKNEAAIRKTDAANQWAYYQAKGQKQNLAELGAALSTSDPASAARFAAEAARYKQEKEPIRVKAEGLEQQVVEADKQSEELVHQHHRWAQATTADSGGDRAVGDHLAGTQPLAVRGGGRDGIGRRGHRGTGGHAYLRVLSDGPAQVGGRIDLHMLCGGTLG